jgi:hypothetical protein
MLLNGLRCRYSWGLSALITFVQVFGFITLTPQALNFHPLRPSSLTQKQTSPDKFSAIHQLQVEISRGSALACHDVLPPARPPQRLLLTPATCSYKFLNTIIDDLFAFVVTMPTLCAPPPLSFKPSFS